MKPTLLLAAALLLALGQPAGAAPRTPEEAWRQMQGLTQPKHRTNLRPHGKRTPPRRTTKQSLRPLHPRSAGPKAEGKTKNRGAGAAEGKDTATTTRAGEGEGKKGKGSPGRDRLKRRMAQTRAKMADLLRRVAGRLEQAAARVKEKATARAKQPGRVAGPAPRAGKAPSKEPAAKPVVARGQISAEKLLGDLRLHQFQQISLPTLGVLKQARMVTEAEYRKLLRLHTGLTELERQLMGPGAPAQQSPPANTPPPPPQQTQQNDKNPFESAL